MIWFYRAVMTLLIPAALVGLFFRGFKNPAYWARILERFGGVPYGVHAAGPFDLWIHAVSVGEARAAAPLVRALREVSPNIKVLVTTTTPTGSHTVDQMLGDEVAHCYFPYDLRWAMQRFARAVNARVGLIMETEIWPEMIRALSEAGTRLVYTNVRLSESSTARYAKLGAFLSSQLAPVELFAAQGEKDRKHLIELGVLPEKITVTGSIKFDVSVPASLFEMAEVTRRQLGSDRLVWIAGSTRDGEEGRLLAAYKSLKEAFPSLLLVIVPRHPERFDYLARKIGRRDLSFVRRSQHSGDVAADVDVYLADTMGELMLLYASSDVAFVGGSLEPLGGQNILEPCAVGVPAVFGPHMFNFPDISRWTIKEGAGIQVQDADELLVVMSRLLANPSERDQIGTRGVEFVRAHKGALDRNIELLAPLLFDEA